MAFTCTKRSDWVGEQGQVCLRNWSVSVQEIQEIAGGHRGKDGDAGKKDGCKEERLWVASGMQGHQRK